MKECKYTGICKFNSGNVTCRNDSLARGYCGIYKTRQAKDEEISATTKNIETTTQDNSVRGLMN